jgi:hypothetical protein
MAALRKVEEKDNVLALLWWETFNGRNRAMEVRQCTVTREAASQKVTNLKSINASEGHDKIKLAKGAFRLALLVNELLGMGYLTV